MKKAVEEKVVGASVKEKFISMLKKEGYNSINSFSKVCGIESPNIHANLNGRYSISVQRLFVMADSLGLPFDDVARIFYEEEFKNNDMAVKAHSKSKRKKSSN